MMSGARNILWLLPLLLAMSWPAWGGLLVEFLTPRGSFETATASESRGKTFTMEEVLFKQFSQGIEDWRIVTSRLSSRPGSEDLMQMEAVDAQLFEDGRGKFHIVSRNGAYDMKKQLLTLSDQVRVESTEGYTITSSLLRYDDRQKEITTEEKVIITTDDMVIKGTGLRYNMETGAYRVGGRVDFQVK